MGERGNWRKKTGVRLTAEGLAATMDCRFGGIWDGFTEDCGLR